MDRSVRVGRPIRVTAALLASMFLFGACASSSHRDLQVRMRYSKFLPATMTVPAGTTVSFEIVNQDPIPHEFIIGTAEEQLVHEKGDPNDPHTGPGEASIGPHETVRLSYTFGHPGTLLYGCHRIGHYAYGMVGTIRVG